VLKSLYEHEIDNKNIYDGVREYCLAEQVNEEYLRGSVSKSGLAAKPKIRNIMAALLILSVIGICISCMQK